MGLNKEKLFYWYPALKDTKLVFFGHLIILLLTKLLLETGENISTHFFLYGSSTVLLIG